jgi:hypothetical protein
MGEAALVMLSTEVVKVQFYTQDARVEQKERRSSFDLRRLICIEICLQVCSEHHRMCLQAHVQFSQACSKFELRVQVPPAFSPSNIPTMYGTFSPCPSQMLSWTAEH